MEINYRVIYHPKDKNYPVRIRVVVMAPSAVLQAYKGVHNHINYDVVALRQRLDGILGSEGEDHSCRENLDCKSMCRMTGLWVINRDYGELEKAHWFMVVSLVKLAWETQEEQVFTLDLEDYTHDFD